MSPAIENKVTSILHLKLLAENGEFVFCPDCSYFANPTEAGKFLQTSVRNIFSWLEKGIYTVKPQKRAEPKSILFVIQSKILELGLTHQEIGNRVGVSKQAVGQFLSAKQASTKTIDKYIEALGLEFKIE